MFWVKNQLISALPLEKKAKQNVKKNSPLPQPNNEVEFWMHHFVGLLLWNWCQKTHQDWEANGFTEISVDSFRKSSALALQLRLGIQFTFQQYDPKHILGTTSEWFQEIKDGVMEWLSQFKSSWTFVEWIKNSSS